MLPAPASTVSARDGDRHGAQTASPPFASRFDLLWSPGFCIALALLLLNDFVLKARFDSWWTGKLSDVAGLAAFAMFWTVCYPRGRRAIFVVTAVTFVVWKSPLATPMLAWWNHLGVWPLARVVDVTDNLALVVLPMAFVYTTARLRHTPRRMPRGLRPALACCSLFAFTATSRVVTVKDGTRYTVPGSIETVVRGMIDVGIKLEPDINGRYPNPFSIYVNEGTAWLSLTPADNAHTVITLVEVQATNSPPSLESVHRALETILLDPLWRHLTAFASP